MGGFLSSCQTEFAKKGPFSGSRLRKIACEGISHGICSALSPAGLTRSSGLFGSAERFKPRE